MTLNKETNFILDFVTKSPTAVETYDENQTKIISVDNGIQIFQCQKSLISVFRLNGSLLKTISTSGNTFIPLSQGFYIMKILAQNDLVLRKAFVK